jgi:ABC-type molybdate transport system substrate-binding protein
MPLSRLAAVAVVAALAASVVAPDPATAQPNDSVTLYAAGSLKAAFTDLIRSFTQQTGIAVTPTFGSSGLLRTRIEHGERADVFASADLENPQQLARDGTSGPVTTFAHNRMCLLTTASAGAGSSVAAIMLDPAVRIITSTPKADPAGDYAERIFQAIDAAQPGSLARLDAKSLRLVGGPDAVTIPAGADPGTYLLITARRGDAFLAYCSGFVAAVAAAPMELRSLPMPASLAVRADYGMTVRTGASADALRLRDFILSDGGQAILAAYGFDRR